MLHENDKGIKFMCVILLKAFNEVRNCLKQTTGQFYEITVLMPNKLQSLLSQMPTSPMKEISEKKEEA